MPKTYFKADLFKFLADLESNNSREWFKANQPRYEGVVRQPALDFITDFAEPLASISPHFVADSRTVGGSLFRIQRDTRFSKDKTPYKLNTGMHFRHEMAKDAHAPGFYIHLQPRNCFMGVGLWQPESKVAYAIRHHIDENQSAWVDSTANNQFAAVFSLGGDSLVRPPRGFDPGHPLIEDLRRKSFMATTKLTQAQVTRRDFMDLFEARCRVSAPFMSMLCEAVGVRF
ncbi:MAG: DUF2461 domain-containing protein [Acidimicrobiales bacterium]